MAEEKLIDGIPVSEFINQKLDSCRYRLESIRDAMHVTLGMSGPLTGQIKALYRAVDDLARAVEAMRV